MSADLAAAIEHHRAGRLAEAEPLYRGFLATAPDDGADHADVRHLLGILLLQQGDAAGAIAEIERACRAAPAVPAYRISQGNALMAAGRVAEAVAAYERAVQVEPANADLQLNLGVALRRLGRVDRAVDHFNRAIEIRPDYAEAHYNLGNALQARGAADQAIEAYLAALARKPELIAAYTNLGAALKSRGRLAEAIGCYRRALALGPDNAEACNNLGIAFQAFGEQAGAVQCFRQALALRPDFAEAHSNLLFGLSYDGRIDDQALFAEYRAWEARHALPLYRLAKPPANDPDPGRRDPDRRLRVGYVSADFRDNAIAYSIEGLFARHDPAVVETFCYMREARTDEVTARLKRLVRHWRDAAALDDAALADLIRGDRIDILVLVAGHTGANRPQLCAYRPAPVQVNLFGLSTLGLSVVDYWLTDHTVHPPDTAERATETLVRLPSWYVHQPPAGAPEVAPPPSASAGFITFGSSNNPAKLTPDVIALWARTVHAVPGARLLLKYLGFFADEAMRQRFTALFGRHGVGPDRLIFVGDELPRARHLEVLNRIDIALDPFPFNGCTTSFEALWMGVPVVTLAGRRFIGRMGASFLARIGLTELIAATPEDYVAKTAALAGDPHRLADLRSGLRQRVAASPLCDATAYARSVEAAYREMWQRWCAGQ
jgi:predicted O-linked N-acetylglucosamine transferase (SPINDLY family)